MNQGRAHLQTPATLPSAEPRKRVRFTTMYAFLRRSHVSCSLRAALARTDAVGVRGGGI
mgnify:CR=1 FL=1